MLAFLNAKNGLHFERFKRLKEALKLAMNNKELILWASLLFGFYPNASACVSSNPQSPLLASSIQQFLGSLGVNQPFIHFDLNLTEKEKQTLKRARVTNTTTYETFGKIDQLQEEVNHFFQAQGNDTQLSQSIAPILERLVRETLLGVSEESAWVCLRASTPNQLFDIPRWHTDGNFYSNSSKIPYKIVITLKGASTLFCSLPPKLRKKFNAMQSDQNSRLKMVELIQPIGTTSPKFGQGCIFVVGTEYAAVHSEPPIHNERLFLSILPGSHKQISELQDRWYPKK